MILLCRRKIGFAMPDLFAGDSVHFMGEWLKLKKIIDLTKCEVEIESESSEEAPGHRKQPCVLLRFGENRAKEARLYPDKGMIEVRKWHTLIKNAADAATERLKTFSKGRDDAAANAIEEFDSDDVYLQAMAASGNTEGGGMVASLGMSGRASSFFGRTSATSRNSATSKTNNNNDSNNNNNNNNTLIDLPQARLKDVIFVFYT